jgi:flavin-binding protein dodecin
MSIARVTEISSQSARSFEDAIRQGLRRANATLRNVTGAWIKEQQVVVTDGRITGYRVNMLVTFILEGGDPVAATRATAPAMAPAKKAAKKKSSRRR